MPTKILTNKQLLKNFKNIQWNMDNGTRTPTLRIGKGKNAVQVYISPEQIILLEKEFHRRRLERMKKAKSRGTVLMHLTAQSSSDQDLTQDAATKVSALVRGYMVRKRLSQMRSSVVKIQQWWRNMVPLAKVFQTHWNNVKEERIQERILEERMNEIMGRSEEITIFVQAHLRMFIERVEFEDRVNAGLILPLQNFVRMNYTQSKFAYVQNTAILVQSRIRQLMIGYSASQGMEQRIYKLKLHILRKYEVLLTPYTRRALFCYNTRQVSHETLRICVRELDALKNRNEPFLSQEAFRYHLTFVLKKLYEQVHNEKLTSIVRSVFQPELIFHAGDRDRMLKRAARALRMEKRSTMIASWKKFKIKDALRSSSAAASDDVSESSEYNYLSNDPNRIPLRFILKEMVKEMFSSRATIHRANFGSVIMLNFVMPDILNGGMGSSSSNDPSGRERPERGRLNRGASTASLQQNSSHSKLLKSSLKQNEDSGSNQDLLLVEEETHQDATGPSSNEVDNLLGN